MKKYLKFAFLILLICNSCSTSNPSDDVEEEVMDENENPDNDPVIEPLVLNEADFYTPPTAFAVTKNFVTDYGADAVFSTNDSSKLQGAINDINAQGGGKLIIPEGNYTFSDIQFKSNVHIVFNANVVVRPNQRSDQRNFKMFVFGEETDTIENISITSNNGERFKIDLTQTNNINVVVFGFRNVNNFLLSDFEVDDILTDFSAVTFGITEYNNDYFWPNNGVIKNGKTNNSDYGYGLVQAQAADNVYFKDLDGIGGITLRLETGVKDMNDLQVGGLHNIFAENISCTNGNTAVMFSPHAMFNGKAYVNGIKSVSSGFAVRIEGGFVASKYTNPNLVDGIFEEVTVLNVEANYGDKEAQLKSKHYKFMPCDLRNLISDEPIRVGGKSYKGPSIAAVVNTPNYTAIMSEKDVIANGFTEGYEVVTEDEAKSDTECGI